MRERGLKDLDDIAGNFGLAMIVINDDDEDLWAPLSVKNRESQSRAVANDDSQLTAHAIHALVLTCILLIASHVQIALRLAASLPFTHWAAARLWIEKPQIAKWWTAWSILWGCTSLVTWTLFLPPA
jgi:phosphatidylinositol glycan class V